MSLRDKQIREILDADLRSYNEVLKREFKQARLMNESYAPPNRLERRVAFDIDKYFIELTKSLDALITEYANSDTIDNPQILTLLSTYDTLIAFLNRYASTHPLNQRDLSTLEDKFDALLPNLEKVAEIADDENSPLSQRLNALYDLIENRNYISLKGNVEEVKGRKQMLVDREADLENPFFNPGSDEPETSIQYRSQDDIHDDDAVHLDFVAAKDTMPDEEISRKEEQADELREVIDRLVNEVNEAYANKSNFPEDAGLDRIYEMKVDKIRSVIEAHRIMQQEITRLYFLKHAREREEQASTRSSSRASEREASVEPPIRRAWELPERRGRERLTKDKLKEYIDNLPEYELMNAVNSFPDMKDALAKQKSKSSLKNRVKNNEAYMRDIYSMLVEGVRPTEFVPTPRGRSRTQQMREESMREASMSLPRQSLSPWNERDQREMFPEEFSDYEPYLDTSAPIINPFWAGEEMDGNGRQGFVKTKRGRFQIRGKGESEDKMFGLPFGFKRALKLRPMDRKPIVHYNGQDFDLTLEERMEFLNQLDSHKVQEEEWKINSVKNLSEMKEHKYKKRK